MDFLKVFILFGYAFAYVVSSEKIEERVKRQSGLNGAHADAMRASSQGGFVTSYNPMLNPNGFGGRVGAGYGTNVWSSGNRNVGVGGAVRSDVGLNNGRPFVRSPELGVGAIYNRGANSFSLGAGRAFGHKPSNQVGFTFSRRFKRSLEDDENEGLHSSPSDFETQPIIKNIDDQEIFSKEIGENNEEDQGKRTRRQAMNSATTNSLTNKPVGRPQFSYQIDGAGNNRRNFGASGSVGAGVKAWERGPQSVGVGIGASGDLASINGKTYTGNHQIGAGVGYQNGRFGATVGAGRALGRFPSNHYGLNLGYRFRRSVEEDKSDETIDNFDTERDEENVSQGDRQKRQAINAAQSNTFSTKTVGQPQFSYQIDAVGKNARNFGGLGSVGTGMKVWERGPHSVGVGLGASGTLNRVDGKSYKGNYQLGAGAGYHNRNGFSATAGVGQGVGPFRTKPFGAVNFQYRFGKK